MICSGKEGRPQTSFVFPSGREPKQPDVHYSNGIFCERGGQDAEDAVDKSRAKKCGPCGLNYPLEVADVLVTYILLC